MRSSGSSFAPCRVGPGDGACRGRGRRVGQGTDDLRDRVAARRAKARERDARGRVVLEVQGAGRAQDRRRVGDGAVAGAERVRQAPVGRRCPVGLRRGAAAASRRARWARCPSGRSPRVPARTTPAARQRWCRRSRPTAPRACRARCGRRRVGCAARSRRTRRSRRHSSSSSSSGVAQPPARVEALGHPSVGQAGADLEQPAGLARDEHRQEGGQGASVATRRAVGWRCGARAHVSSVASGVRWAMNQYSPSTSSTSCG